MRNPSSLLRTPLLVLALSLFGAVLVGCGEEPPEDEPFKSDVVPPEVEGNPAGDATIGEPRVDAPDNTGENQPPAN